MLAQLVPDDLLAARLRQVLKGRRQPMPLWLTDLESAGVQRVVEMTHALGDGDDYFLEVRLPTGEMMTALVYVDHNMGGIVKDAFADPPTHSLVLSNRPSTRAPTIRRPRSPTWTPRSSGPS